MSDGEDAGAARAFNARIAGQYDALAYEPVPEPLLDPERVLGMAAVYGCAPAPGQGVDVLDLGCGVGVQLERAAARTEGALVGTDISPAACARAQARLAGAGGRVRIIAADLLDLDPEALGRFDLIYCSGVISIVPEPVRRRIVALIGACLKPGGVAVLSYYAGSFGELVAETGRLLRVAVRAAAPPETQIAQARERLKAIHAELPEGPGSRLSRAAVELVAGHADVVLFHESLNPTLAAAHTSALESGFRSAGVHFLTYLPGMTSGGLPDSRRRALGADVFDYVHGGYRHALFGKPAGDDSTPLTVSAVPALWRTSLVRLPEGPPYGPTARFQDPAIGTIRTAMPLVEAALVEAAEGPARFAAILDGASARLAAHGLALPDNAAQVLDAELSILWPAGLFTPLRPGR